MSALQMIDRASPMPLYYQLRQILLDKLKASEWQPGDLIPTEQELEEAYGLSRTTVRQALADLVADGYLIRQRGRGTTVAQRKIAFDPSSALELRDYMRAQGVDLGWRLLDTELIGASDDVAAKLQLDLNGEAKVYRIRRLRLAGKEALGYHFAYLPEALVPFIARDALLTGDSLAYIRDAPSMRAGKPRIERTLEARIAGETEAELLGIRGCAAVLHMERIVRAEDGTPIEYLQAAFSGERFKYKINM